MKTTLYTLCTAALLLASCANDPAEGIPAGIPDTNGGNLPQGTFVIDYTASTGDASTRATAAERIQSLDYLLYEKAAGSDDFLLKHRRTIPDIGGNTVWPLTRETMTWAQREALKDTLNTNCKYKMVFVANAGKKSDGTDIWDKDVLEDVTVGDNFNAGRLVLPPRLFTDNDMYYMWSNHNAPLDGSRYNKDNPASMEITLERMINKVEVRLDEEIPADETELDKQLTEKVTAYYNELLSPTNAEGLYSELQTGLTNLADGISPGANYDYDVSYRGGKTKVATCIKSEDFIAGIIEGELATFLQSFKDQLFQLYKTQCYWQAASTVQIEYNENAYAQSIDFSRKTYHSNEADPLSYKLQNNTFIYYAFGNNSPNDNLNKVKNYQFMEEEGSNSPLFMIPAESLSSNQEQGGNHYLQFSCNPIGTINDTATKTYTFSINIVTKYETINNCTWNDEHFGFDGDLDWRSVTDMEKRFDNNSTYKTANEYWEASTLRDIKLKLDYPDVTVSPTWEQNQ